MVSLRKKWMLKWFSFLLSLKCLAPEDVINPPEDILAVSFDDGPTPFSDDLYSFLKTNNQAATHFMIGSQILTHIDQFKNAVSTGLQQFAVHTWVSALSQDLGSSRAPGIAS